MARCGCSGTNRRYLCSPCRRCSSLVNVLGGYLCCRVADHPILHARLQEPYSSSQTSSLRGAHHAFRARCFGNDVVGCAMGYAALRDWPSRETTRTATADLSFPTLGPRHLGICSLFNVVYGLASNVLGC